MPETGDEPTILRRLLGTQLRTLRESRKITAQHAAEHIRGTPSKISRIENGKSAIREIDIIDLLRLYGVGPVEREQLLELAEQANQRGWWQQYSDVMPSWFQAYVGMEGSAKTIRVYEPLFVPGLLQTEAYAAAVLSLGDVPVSEIERHVYLRKERHRRFIEGNLKLWAIVDESALRRQVGGPKVLREQLTFLMSLCTKKNLTLQVTPTGSGGHAAPGGFSILRFEDKDLGDVVYVEHLTSAMYLHKRQDVDRYLLAIERLSIISEKPARTQGILHNIIDQITEGERDGYPQWNASG
jgi:transcriptional regulator with XRE-family HTH domain